MNEAGSLKLNPLLILQMNCCSTCTYSSSLRHYSLILTLTFLHCQHDCVVAHAAHINLLLVKSLNCFHVTALSLFFDVVLVEDTGCNSEPISSLRHEVCHNALESLPLINLSELLYRVNFDSDAVLKHISQALNVCTCFRMSPSNLDTRLVTIFYCKPSLS